MMLRTNSRRSPTGQAQRHMWATRMGLLLLVGSLVVTMAFARVAHATTPPQQIVYASQSSPEGLWQMNLDGSSPQSLLAGSTWPDYSADGSKLLYVTGGSPVCNADAPEGQIHVANADGSDPVLIGSGCEPRISPDGKSVLYLQVGGTPALFVAPVSDPTDAVQLLPFSGCTEDVNKANPAYPDAEFGNDDPGPLVCEFPEIADWAGNNNIVFGSFNIGVWELPEEGGIPHPLITSGGVEVQDSDWFEGLEVNPAGTLIAGAASSPAINGIATLPVTGGTPTLIAQDPEASSESYAYPQWSGDETQLVLTDHVNKSTVDVATMPAGGGEPKTLNAADGTAIFPTFAPNACGAGGAEVKSVDQLQPDPHGAPIGTTVTLEGRGFCPGMSIEFGNKRAVIEPKSTDIAAGGKVVVVEVPRLATTGKLTVTVNNQTASLPSTFDVDSFRNTDGFSFPNSAGVIGLSDFEHVFGTQNTMVSRQINPCGKAACPTTVLVPTAATMQAFFADRKDFGHGLCFGWDLAAQRLSAGGDTALASFDPTATVPWDLDESAGLNTFIVDQHLTQFSDQVPAIRRANQAASSSELRSQLEVALSGGIEEDSNGAIVEIYQYSASGWRGHALLAYDVEPQEGGGFLIYVADPNHTFTTDENEDTTGVKHAEAVNTSTIKVNAEGLWYSNALGWAGTLRTIDVTPYSALLGAIDKGLTFSDPGPGALRSEVAPGTSLQALQDPAGQAVEISNPAPASGVEFEPVLDESASPDYSFSGPAGNYVQTLSGSNPSELIETDGIEAAIDASAGTDVLSFDPTSGTVSLGGSAAKSANSAHPASVKGAAPSHTATLSLLAGVGASERNVSMTGPAAAGTSLTFAGSHGALILKAGAKGRYSLTLSTQGASVGAQELKVIVKLGAEERATLTPNWTSLSARKVPVTLRPAHGHPRRLRLADHASVPHATITSVKVAAKAAKIGLRIPGLVGGTVQITASVLAHGHELEQASTVINAGSRPSHSTATVTLTTAPPHGSRIVVLAATESATPIPTLASAQRSVRVR
jgi:hypothetical protein